MRLFNEEVLYTSSNSASNILQVENFQEIFFGVYEVEINENKYPVEKISDHDGDPVVSVPVEQNGEIKYYPFVLKSGKFKIFFNENCQDVGDFISKPVEILQEVVETKTIIQEEFEEEILEDEGDEHDGEFLKLGDYKKGGGFGERVQILEATGKEKISQSTEFNILQVKNYNEVFFDVYEIETDNNKFQVEKTNTYRNCPVVSVTVEIDGEYRKYPFLLVKSDDFHVFFNENTDFEKIENLIKEEVKEEEVVIYDESDEPDDNTTIDDYEKEQLIREIENTKEKAYKLATEKLEKKKKADLRLINEKAQKWENRLKGIISDSKDGLIEEFNRISEGIRSSVLEENHSILLEIKSSIDEQIENSHRSLIEEIREELESNKDELRKNIGRQVPKIYADKVQPFLQKERENLFKIIKERIERGEKDLQNISNGVVSAVDEINRKIEESFENLDKKSIDIELTLRDLFNKKLSSIQEENNKSIRKAHTNIGNVNKKVDDITLKILEHLQSKIADFDNDIREFVSENIRNIEENNKQFLKETDGKLDNFSKDVSKKLDATIGDIKTTTKKLLDENVKKVVDDNKKVSEDFHTNIESINENISQISKKLKDKIEKAEKASKDLIDEKIRTFSESNTVSHDEHHERIDELEDRVRETSEILNDRISDVNDSINELFNEKINILEGNVGDLVEWREEWEKDSKENKEEVIKMITEARDNLIKEINQLKDERTVETYFEESDFKGDLIQKDVKSELDKKIDDKFQSLKTELKKHIVYASGGGTNALQLQDGGTINGDLNVAGAILSGGRNLLDIFTGGGGGSDVSTLSSNWQNTYTIVQANSASWGMGGGSTNHNDLINIQGGSANEYYHLTEQESRGLSWMNLTTSWTVEPTLNTTLSSGEVYDYVYGSTTYYRFVPIPYDSTQDAFYGSFNGGSLSALKATRGNPI